MPRRPFVVLNWKMAMTLEETRDFVVSFQALDEGRADGMDVVVFPPATALATLAKLVQNTPLQVGAQTLSVETDPAHTGQLSGELLVDAGASWVLIGHSEVQRDFGADASAFNAMVHRALASGLRPVLLLGEEHLNDDVASRLRERVNQILAGCTAGEILSMGFVYEPAWAVGQDEPASPERVEEGVSALRAALSEIFGAEVGDGVQIIYGGSVTPEDAEALLGSPLLDGLGMGRKGRDPRAVAELVAQIRRQRPGEEASSYETQLWYRLLFGGILSTRRAKELLIRWDREGYALAEILRSPEKAEQLGFSLEEARKIQAVEDLPPTPAVRWNEAAYPDGLRNLPVKVRPALLFYRGNAALLQRSIVYLPPGPLPAEDRDLIREMVSLLLGESLSPSVLWGSEQAALLLEEMTHAEGEILLFVRSGLDQVDLGEREKRLLERGRLLLVSPLPPGTAPNPQWDDLLAEIEGAAAHRCILTTKILHVSAPTCPQTPTLWLTSSIPEASLPGGIHRATDPAGVLLWLADIKPGGPRGRSASDNESDLGPPPTPEETLGILEKGGSVPEVLRKRLLGE